VSGPPKSAREAVSAFFAAINATPIGTIEDGQFVEGTEPRPLVVTFDRFDGSKQDEFTDASIRVNGEHRGCLTRVTGEPPFGCPVVLYIATILDMGGKDVSQTFRVTRNTSAQKALYDAKTWARGVLANPVKP
jgi:hypothetical protein